MIHMEKSRVEVLLPRGMSRREFARLLGASGLGGLSPMLSACAGESAGADARSLSLFTWTSWGADGFVDHARTTLGVELVPTFYSSADEMMAKLRGGGTRIYDMIVPTQNYVEPAVRAGLIEPLDPARLTNSAHVFPEFQGSPFWTVDGALYGVPFVWGANAIAFNRAETGEVDSLAPLFDGRFSGRVAIRDEPEDTLAIAALHLGIERPYAMGEAELQEVKKLLIAQKPQVRAYYRNVADVQNMLASGEVVIAWTFLAVVAPLREAGVDLGWVWPKEGAIGWSESITPVAGTPKLDLVHEYANYTLSPEYGEMMARTTRYAPTTQAAVDRLEPEMVQELGIDTSRIEQMVFKEIPPNKARWNEIWNEVKAS
jgi:spermidine/putrescine-binding protein